jgi:hypothetical protein
MRFVFLQVGCLETSRVGGIETSRQEVFRSQIRKETSRLEVWKALARRFGDFQGEV